MGTCVLCVLKRVVVRQVNGCAVVVVCALASFVKVLDPLNKQMQSEQNQTEQQLEISTQHVP